jgi:hypothetical protein
MGLEVIVRDPGTGPGAGSWGVAPGRVGLPTLRPMKRALVFLGYAQMRTTLTVYASVQSGPKTLF